MKEIGEAMRLITDVVGRYQSTGTIPIKLVVRAAEATDEFEITAQAWVPDVAYWRQHPKAVTVPRIGVFRKDTVDNDADEITIRACVERLVREVYLHEFEEWLHFDGQPVFNAHRDDPVPP